MFFRSCFWEACIGRSYFGLFTLPVIKGQMVGPSGFLFGPEAWGQLLSLSTPDFKCKRFFLHVSSPHSLISSISQTEISFWFLVFFHALERFPRDKDKMLSFNSQFYIRSILFTHLCLKDLSTPVSESSLPDVHLYSPFTWPFVFNFL